MTAIPLEGERAETKKEKSQAKSRLLCEARRLKQRGLYSFSVLPVRAAISGLATGAKTGKNSPESGCEVSGVGGLVSRKNDGRHTKS